MTPQQLFEKKIQKGASCWVWTASKNREGYGHFGFRGSTHLAHRVSWILYRGEIENNLCVLHHCDNPSCVNPGHLFLGTRLDNMRDCARKGRKNPQRGEESPCAKLTSKDVISIKQKRKAGMSTRKIAEDYGVSSSTISMITTGRNWRHI